jgi:hypothetical protein
MRKGMKVVGDWYSFLKEVVLGFEFNLNLTPLKANRTSRALYFSAGNMRKVRCFHSSFRFYTPAYILIAFSPPPSAPAPPSSPPSTPYTSQ